MSKKETTPGFPDTPWEPWEVIPESEIEKPFDAVTWEAVRCRDGEIVAYIAERDCVYETACLIAAAPDMYEAYVDLEEAVANLENVDGKTILAIAQAIFHPVLDKACGLDK